VAPAFDPTLAGPSRPLGSPEIPQFHAPAAARSGVYVPSLFGAARIHFLDRKRKIDETRRVAYRAALAPTAKVIDWESAEPLDVLPEQLLEKPQVVAPYLPLPVAATDTARFTRWARQFDRWLARTQRLPVPSGDGPSTSIGPKRGGVSVELVAILWELVPVGPSKS
jgi:hypothetical protein